MRRDEICSCPTVWDRDEEVKSLHPQTNRIRLQIHNWQMSGRKHWDLYRHLLSEYVLQDALRLVIHNKGSAGIDKQTIQSVIGAEHDFVKEIISELKSGAYQPSAVKRVYIPKKDGTKRPLGIPTLKDRVIQRALVLLMEPIYESIFLDFSFGFRPQRRARDCAWVVGKAAFTHRIVFDADIEKFFDQVNQSRLMHFLKREIVDPRIHKLVWKFLKSGFLEPGKTWQPNSKGTPQGGPLSPLLANIYLHYALDVKFQEEYGDNRQVKLIRYADDFVILCKHSEDARRVERKARHWLFLADLKLKESKTRWVDMRNHNRSHTSKFDFLGFKFHMRSFKDNPKHFWIARQPSEASRKALHESLKSKLHVGMSLEVARERILETWLGWGEYFKHSNGNRVIHREMARVREVGLWWLARKYRRQRKAVPWGKLRELNESLTRGVGPIQVVPNLSKGDQLRLANL
jgi:group II intron reverse transcriptase/maturase